VALGLILAGVAAAVGVRGDSWSANTGWINWELSGSYGVSFARTYAYGYI
jgi:hypothetical protein